jgi:uncharacterized repeat protein (TIGR02543 family)
MYVTSPTNLHISSDNIVDDGTIPNANYVAPTLYARWTYNVTYNANGGDGNTLPAQTNGIIRGNNFTITSIKPTKTGYTFLGWSTTQTATDATFTSGQTVKDIAPVGSTATRTLYAIWEADKYKVTFNDTANLHSVGCAISTAGPGEKEITYETTMATPITVPTSACNTFDGYYTQGGTQYYDKDGNKNSDRPDKWGLDRDLILYAKWATKTFQIENINKLSAAEIHPGSGTTSYPGKCGDSTKLSRFYDDAGKYEFEGYYTDANLTNKIMNISGCSDTTLYLKWQYTVVYDANYGEGTPPNSQVYIFNVEKPAFPNNAGK